MNIFTCVNNKEEIKNLGGGTWEELEGESGGRGDVASIYEVLKKKKRA